MADDACAGIGETTLGSGVGLRNLRQRLQALYGTSAGFVLRRTDEGMTEAVLTLPALAGLELAA